MARHWCIALVPVLLLALAGAAAPAEGRLKARSTLETAAGKTRLVVKLTSTKRLTARTQPRRVSARTGKRTVRLSRLKGARVVLGGGTWRSTVLKGRTLRGLRASVGKRLTITVMSRAGTVRIRPELRSRRTGGGRGGPRLFDPPGRELIGTEAFDHFSKYFFDSRFTDCVAGWPFCAVEERYSHCNSTGAWQHHILTPNPATDVHSSGNLEVIYAEAHADGSWLVDYGVIAHGSKSYYHWEVLAGGVVTGRYWAPGTDPQGPPSEQLGLLTWAQPARCR